MLSDERIIESFNAAKEAGHPDPLGFISRGKVKTDLSFDGDYKGAVGSFGISLSQAMNAGYDHNDVLSTEGNLLAGIEVDMNNLRKSGNDLDGMYRLSNDGNKKTTDRFMKRLDKERKSFHERITYDEDGNIVQLRKKQKDDALDITKSLDFSSEDGHLSSAKKIDKKDKRTDIDRVAISKNRDRVIYSRTNKSETPDDIVKQTKEYIFRSKDKDKIDEMLMHLVNLIIDEKPMDFLSESTKSGQPFLK